MEDQILTPSSFSPSSLIHAHSVCFQYNSTVPEKIPVKSAILIPSHVSCPAIWKDNSVSQVTESLLRRKMHAELLRKNPGVFRRQAGETQEHFARKHNTRDLLNAIHIVADPNDLVPQKYTFSRLKKDSDVNPPSFSSSFQEKRTSGTESSVSPEHVRSRQTGYSPGLLRSLLQSSREPSFPSSLPTSPLSQPYSSQSKLSATSSPFTTQSITCRSHDYYQRNERTAGSGVGNYTLSSFAVDARTRSRQWEALHSSQHKVK